MASMDALEAVRISQDLTGGESRVFRGLDEVPRGSAQHPIELWEVHKDEIRRLYLDEQRTLREVVNIMSRKGFRATPKTYKTKIKQWNFVKNKQRRNIVPRRPKNIDRSSKSPTKGDIPSIQDDRRSTHKEGHINMHDRVAVSPRYTGTYHPITLSAPGILGFREGLIGGLRELLYRHYSLDPILNRGIVPFLGHILSDSRQTVNDLIQSSWLFAEKQNEQGGMFAKKAFYMLVDLFRDQNFYSLLYLFISLPRLKDSGLLELLWNCLAGNANSRDVLGQPHQLSILIRLMRQFYHSYGAAEFAFAIHDAMKAIFKLVEGMNNVDDFCMTWLKCDYAWSIGFDQPWVQKLQKEVVSLRNSLGREIEDEEIQAWARSMSLHLQAVRRLEAAETQPHSVEAEDFVNNLRPPHDSSCDSDTIQTMCFQTMSQYYRGLHAINQLAITPQRRLGEHFLDSTAIFDGEHWVHGEKAKPEDVRQFEVWNTRARRWEEIEAAKVKLVTTMWMLP